MAEKILLEHKANNGIFAWPDSAYDETMRPRYIKGLSIRKYHSKLEILKEILIEKELINFLHGEAVTYLTDKGYSFTGFGSEGNNRKDVLRLQKSNGDQKKTWLIISVLLAALGVTTSLFKKFKWKNRSIKSR